MPPPWAAAAVCASVQRQACSALGGNVAAVQAPAAPAVYRWLAVLLGGTAAAATTACPYQHVVWFRRPVKAPASLQITEKPPKCYTNTVCTNTTCTTSHRAPGKPANVPPRAGAAASWWSAAAWRPRLWGLRGARKPVGELHKHAAGARRGCGARNREGLSRLRRCCACCALAKPAALAMRARAS